MLSKQKKKDGSSRYPILFSVLRGLSYQDIQLQFHTQFMDFPTKFHHGPINLFRAVVFQVIRAVLNNFIWISKTI